MLHLEIDGVIWRERERERDGTVTLSGQNAVIGSRLRSGPCLAKAVRSCVIYGVLSPIGPSVMAVLCPIKIIAGASRGCTPEIKSLHVELIYIRNIRPLFHHRHHALSIQ